MILSLVAFFDYFSPVNSPIEESVIPPALTELDEGDADLLYTNESLLPQVDWDNLERQLKRAQVERERYDKVKLDSFAHDWP